MKKQSTEGILKSNSGILSGIRNRIREDEEESHRNVLSSEISRQSFLVATRLERSKDAVKMARLTSALILFSQAQTLTSTDNREARKLFNLAKRLGR